MSVGQRNRVVGLSRVMAVALTCSAVLVGCATTRWVHPDRPGQSIDADRQACEAVARAEVPRPEAQPSVVNFTGLANLIRMMEQAGLDREYEAEVERHAAECLKKKGWRPVEAK